jgi:N-acetyl-D-muramate 6-phosphate phosphatase
MKKNQTLQCVLLDLDGTLIDTSEDFLACLTELAHNRSLHIRQDFNIKHHISYGSIGIIQGAFESKIVDRDIEELSSQFLELYASANGNFSAPYDGINDLLEYLTLHNIKWGVVTNKPLVYAQTLLERLNVDAACLICPDHVSQKKPHPESLLLACKQLDVKARNTVYIGDHSRDIIAGKAAGMTTIAAAYGYIEKNTYASEWHADYYAKDAIQIRKIIQTHCNVNK